MPLSITLRARYVRGNRLRHQHTYHRRGVPLQSATYADAMILAGAEATITPLAVAPGSSAAWRCPPNDPQRPPLFPLTSGGMALFWERAGRILIMEEYEHAKARNAQIYAEIVGYGNTDDAYHHHRSPIRRARAPATPWLNALEEAGFHKETDSLYLNAHGTSTELNDKKNRDHGGKKALGDNAYDIYGQFHQIDDRPYAGRRLSGNHCQRDGAEGGRDPAHHWLSGPDPGAT